MRLSDYFRLKNAPITFLLVLANIIVFLYLDTIGSTESGAFMLEHGAMSPYRVLYMGEWYRLFTCMFLHFGIRHLFNNMLLLFTLGQLFERAVGSIRFMIIYLMSGLLASFLSFFVRLSMLENDIVAGASGAIFGVIGGMLIVVIVNKGHYAGISFQRMLLMALLTVYFGMVTAGTDNIGHLGGLFSGIILTFILYGIATLYSLKRRC